MTFLRVFSALMLMALLSPLASAEIATIEDDRLSGPPLSISPPVDLREGFYNCISEPANEALDAKGPTAKISRQTVMEALSSPTAQCMNRQDFQALSILQKTEIERSIRQELMDRYVRDIARLEDPLVVCMSQAVDHMLTHQSDKIRETLRRQVVSALRIAEKDCFVQQSLLGKGSEDRQKMVQRAWRIIEKKWVGARGA